MALLLKIVKRFYPNRTLGFLSWHFVNLHCPFCMNPLKYDRNFTHKIMYFKLL